MPKSTPRFMERGVDTCRLIDFPVVASGQLPQPFREWLGEANDQMFFLISVSQMSAGRFWTRTTPFWGWDIFTGVPTSSKHYLWRRHLDSKMAAPEMTSIRTWGESLEPYWGGGAKWRPFRFRSPSWITSFAEPEMRSSNMATGSGRAAILRLRLNRGPKTLPILLMCPPSTPSRWEIPGCSLAVPYKERYCPE